MHGFRQELANMFFDELGDAVGILAGNKARGKFGVSLGRNNRLGAFALIAAPNTIQLERGTDPELLDDSEALFAAVTGSANGLLKSFAAPGQCVQSFAFGLGKLLDVIVEARNGDTKIFVMQICEQLRKNRERIGNSAAVHAGMKIANGPGEFELIII